MSDGRQPAVAFCQITDCEHFGAWCIGHRAKIRVPSGLGIRPVTLPQYVVSGFSRTVASGAQGFGLPYSYRSATTGLRDVARQIGHSIDTVATRRRNPPLIARVRGSCPYLPTSNPPISPSSTN